jgi:hypothetical protein
MSTGSRFEAKNRDVFFYTSSNALRYSSFERDLVLNGFFISSLNALSPNAGWPCGALAHAGKDLKEIYLVSSEKS